MYWQQQLKKKKKKSVLYDIYINITEAFDDKHNNKRHCKAKLCSVLLLLVLFRNEKVVLCAYQRYCGWIKTAFETVESTFCGESMIEFSPLK